MGPYSYSYNIRPERASCLLQAVHGVQQSGHLFTLVQSGKKFLHTPNLLFKIFKISKKLLTHPKDHEIKVSISCFLAFFIPQNSLAWLKPPERASKLSGWLRPACVLEDLEMSQRARTSTYQMPQDWKTGSVKVGRVEKISQFVV